jgi:diadenosine tetraphosphate (Ap4A) HIT family hydrolase
MPFALHPALTRDTVEIARLTLCRALLMKDRRFPWLILVPERAEIREIHELPPEDRKQLVEEIALAGQVLGRIFRPAKLNVGALGNIVPQLHVHVVARFENDPAWPGPVWGSGPADAYTDTELSEICERLAKALNATRTRS